MTDIAGWMKSVEARFRDMDRRIRNVNGTQWQDYSVGTNNAILWSNVTARFSLDGPTVHVFFKGFYSGYYDPNLPISFGLPLPARAHYTKDTMVGTGMYHNPGVMRQPLLIGMGADIVGDGKATFWTAMTNNAWLTANNAPGGAMSGDEFMTAQFSYEAIIQ
jgi:hypothetical protein